MSKQNPKDADITTLLSLIEAEYNRFKNNTSRYNFNNFNAIFDKVVNYFDKLCGENNKAKPMHNVTNMALLDGRTNTSISNSVFEVKRQIILQKDAEGSYIPLCTRNVFLKYYNRNDTSFIGNQSFYWSESDRQNYSADIQNVLKSYLIPGANKKKDENKDENQETDEIVTIEEISNE